MSSTTEGSPRRCSPSSVRSNELDLSTICMSKETFLYLSRTHKENFLIEDHIIDRLANSNLIHSKTEIKNPWLKNPFKRRQAFSISPSGQFQVHLKSRYTELRELFVKYGFVNFITEFEGCFLEVLKNPSQYFNQFHRIDKQLILTYHFGAVLFLFFLARHFKGKVVADALEFLLLFDFRINQKFPSDSERKSYFLEAIEPHQDPEIIRGTATWHQQILGDDRWASLSPMLLFELFKLYVQGHRLFQEPEKTII